MIRLVSFSLFVMCVFWTSIVSAAQVQAVKWGLGKDNVLRIVVDADDNIGYNVMLTEQSIVLRVNGTKLEGIPSQMAVKSSVANKLEVQTDYAGTIVVLPLTHSINADGYKAFTLRKDPVTNRPFRVVLDITADKNLNVGAQDNKPAVVNPNKPVVSNQPTGSTTVVKPSTPTKPNTPVVKPSEPAKPSTPVVKPSTPEKPSTTVKPSAPVVKDNYKVQAIKAKKKYRVGGGLKGKVIVVDPGHGGSDPGAIGSTGLKEKQVTLPTAKFLKKELEERGAKVFLTRTADIDLTPTDYSDRDELQARVNVAEKNNADVFVSLHINASVDEKVGGFSTYYYKKTADDEKLAHVVQKQLADNFGVPNFGTREANFYVVKRSSMPSILIEMCFITNKKEEKLMAGNWFRKKTAKMIAEGLEKYFK